MHEHLDDYKLINMNGRMYDPVLRQMLSPDPVLQDPSNTQNYNKYAYVFNNPLKYTDPSGFIGTPMASGESMQQWSVRTIRDKYGNGLGSGGGRGGGAGYGDEGGYNVDGMPVSAHQMMMMTTKLVHKEVYDANNNKISDEYIRVSNGLIEGMSVVGDCSEYGLESGMSYNPNNGQVFDVAATTNNEYLAAEIRAGEVEKNSNGQYVAIYNHEYGGLAGWKGGVKEGSKPMTFASGEWGPPMAQGGGGGTYTAPINPYTQAPYASGAVTPSYPELILIPLGATVKTAISLYRLSKNSTQQNPYGIPNNWVAKPSKKGDGTVYVDPSNNYNQVRIMPGNPYSPNPAQQSSYVKLLMDGKYLDVNGNVVPANSLESHIPASNFWFPH